MNRATGWQVRMSACRICEADAENTGGWLTTTSASRPVRFIRSERRAKRGRIVWRYCSIHLFFSSFFSERFSPPEKAGRRMSSIACPTAWTASQCSASRPDNPVSASTTSLAVSTAWASCSSVLSFEVLRTSLRKGSSFISRRERLALSRLSS